MTALFSEVEPCHSLRPYQKNTVKEVWCRLKAHRKVLLHAPTGSGKTRMAMATVSFHMREKGPTMVLWLAPTSELIEQAADAFSTAWQHHGDVRAAVIPWWGEGEAFAHGMTLARNTMLIAGLQMIVKEVSTNSEALRMLRNRVSLIVFDEAHTSVAPTYRSLVEQVTNNDESKLLLGLSATPGRACPEEARQLATMYGNHKVGVSPPDSNPIHFLVEKEYLAHAHFRRLNFSDALTLPAVSSEEEYSEDTLRTLGEIDDRNQMIIQTVTSLFNSHHLRIMVFTPSVGSAKYCAERMRQTGFDYAYAVHGGLPHADRNHILDNYRARIAQIPHPQVIFNCRVLTAGVDLPQTSAVVIGKPTKSAVLLQQMIGRALRGPKSGGTSEADIVLIVDDSFEDFARLSDMFSQWDNLWEPTSV